MEVSFDGAKGDLSRKLGSGFDQFRTQDLHPCLHGFGRDQDLRHEEFIPPKLVSHNVHSGDEPIAQYLRGWNLRVQSLLDELGHFLIISLPKFFGNLLKQFHHVPSFDHYIVSYQQASSVKIDCGPDMRKTNMLFNGRANF